MIVEVTECQVSILVTKTDSTLIKKKVNPGSRVCAPFQIALPAGTSPGCERGVMGEGGPHPAPRGLG